MQGFLPSKQQVIIKIDPILHLRSKLEVVSKATLTSILFFLVILGYKTKKANSFFASKIKLF